MKITKDTAKFFSVASKPGSFGATIYNRLFALFGINAVYLPVGVSAHIPFQQTFDALNLIGAQGINVSMPFKRAALDVVRNFPAEDNINTMVRHGPENWYGHNTDAYGFQKCLESLPPVRSVFILGRGAVAHSVMETLNKKGITDYTAGTNKSEKHHDLFVNATPLGMDGFPTDTPWDRLTANSKYVIDAVVHHESRLIKYAREQKKPCVPGYIMCMHQLAQQFHHHYPHHEDVLHLVKEEMKEMKYDL